MSCTRFDVSSLTDDHVRNLLIQVSLEWERRFAVAPPITSTITEYGVAKPIEQA
jgi:hypothetical protein